MTSSSRVLLLLVGTLTAGLAACGSPSSPSSAPSAAIAGPSAAAAEPNAIPPGTSSQWPSPEDCEDYDPHALDLSSFDTYRQGVKYTYWKITNGKTGAIWFEFSHETDARNALALAQSYRRHCYVGRTGALHGNPYDDSLDYWQNPYYGAPAPPLTRCQTYNPVGLHVDVVNGNWEIRQADNNLVVYWWRATSQLDAEKTKLVLQHFNLSCRIGSQWIADNGIILEQTEIEWFQYVRPDVKG
jgi:hypothetical protein